LIWLIAVAVVFVAGGTWFVAKSMQTRVVVLGLGLVAVAAYWLTGRPDMSDRPLEVRIAEIEDLARRAPEQLDENQTIALAMKRAQEQPKDPIPHLFIGKMYESLAAKAQANAMALAQAGKEQEANREAAKIEESLTKAQEAYGAVLRRDPNNVEAITDLADLRFKTTGEVDGFTTQLYQAAFKAQPDHFRLGYLAGIGMWLEGRKDEAEALWADINARAPAAGPERQMFAALRQMFGIDPAPGGQPASPPKPPG
jgi:cytochrome c-type biogenesis protein CcmH/NrfG